MKIAFEGVETQLWEGSGKDGGKLFVAKKKSNIRSRQDWGNGGAYQSRGVGAINAEQGDGSAGLLGRGGIGPDAVNGGGARNGELGGTQASAGEASGHHCAIGWRSGLGEGGGTLRVEWGGDIDVRSACFSQGCKVETSGPNVPVVTCTHTRIGSRVCNCLAAST